MASRSYRPYWLGGQCIGEVLYIERCVGGRVASRAAVREKSLSSCKAAGSRLACWSRVSAAVVFMAPVIMVAALRCMVVSFLITVAFGCLLRRP